jgi:hypothetical protein
MTKYLVVKEFGEIMIVFALLLVWRPRLWPQFFALDVPQDLSMDEDNENF